MCPKVSIITVVYNDVHNISRTVESIIGQSYSNLEYIVIDGDSVDGTKDVVKTYLSSIDVYISEDDNGIYDAMNKGVSLSSGDWILFMNSGDVFYNGDVVSNIFCASIPLASSLIYGDTIFRYDEKDVLTTYNSKNIRKIVFINICHHVTSLFFVEENIYKDYNSILVIILLLILIFFIDCTKLIVITFMFLLLFQYMMRVKDYLQEIS
ncbi:glycosyltransferase [Bacteroides fragilis]